MVCCGDMRYSVGVFIIWEEKKSNGFGNGHWCNDTSNALNFALTVCKLCLHESVFFPVTSGKQCTIHQCI
jgi:hypothetical protein